MLWILFPIFKAKLSKFVRFEIFSYLCGPFRVGCPLLELWEHPSTKVLQPRNLPHLADGYFSAFFEMRCKGNKFYSYEQILFAKKIKILKTILFFLNNDNFVW